MSDHTWDIDFWKPSTEEAMTDAYQRLVNLGMDADEAHDLLIGLYATIGEEYGE